MTKIKKFLICLFFGLYIILPSYFGIELSSSLPLITGSRILILILFVYLLFTKSGKLILVFKNIRKNTILIYLFLALLILFNIVNLTKTNESFKEIFSIIIEQLLLFVLILNLIDSKESLHYSLKILVVSSVIVSLFAVIESLFDFNVFYLFNTVNREMLMASFNRMGLRRAEAGFGHAVYYGTYCVVMIPICLYFFEQNFTKKWGYLFAALMNFIGCVFSNSRGSLVAFFIMLLIYILFVPRILKKNYRFILPLIFFTGFIIFLLNDSINEFISNQIKSLTNIFSSNKQVIENYGENEAGIDSRLDQFSGMYWTLLHYPFTGFGPKAQTRGEINYFVNNQWVITSTFDNGLVAIFCTYGILGFISYIIIYIYLLMKSFTRKNSNFNLKRMFFFCILTYLICLFSVSQVDKLFWIIISLFFAYLHILTEGTNNECF